MPFPVPLKRGYYCDDFHCLKCFLGELRHLRIQNLKKGIEMCKKLRKWRELRQMGDGLFFISQLIRVHCYGDLQRAVCVCVWGEGSPWQLYFWVPGFLSQTLSQPFSAPPLSCFQYSSPWWTLIVWLVLLQDENITVMFRLYEFR